MSSCRSTLNAVVLATLIFPAADALAEDVCNHPSRPVIMELQTGMIKVYRVDAPFQTAVIGNPNVANASAINLNVISVTGRGPGLTNLILFDQEGEEISCVNVQVVQANNYSAGDPVSERREIRVISLRGENEERLPDRRYVCSHQRGCSEISIDRPVEFNPPGNSSAAIGTPPNNTSINLNQTTPPSASPAPPAPASRAPPAPPSPAPPSDQYRQ
jgi:hypothetical protein